MKDPRGGVGWGGWLAVGAATVLGCSREVHYLGYDRDGVEILTANPEPMDGGADAPTPTPEPDDEPGSPNSPDSPDSPDSPAGAGGESNPPRPGDGGGGTTGSGGDEPGSAGDPTSNPGGAGGEPSPPRVDSGLSDGGSGSEGDEAPPNHFVDLLGEPAAAVDRRIEERFQQLFHGDPASEAIYFEVEGGSAYIRDTYHQDTRADALGAGLLISVWLDKQTEFDAVWTFTKTFVQYSEGPRAGLFHSICPDPGLPCDDDVGVFGGFGIVTALLLAEARRVLDTFRTLESRNTDDTIDVTDIFGAEQLPARFPSSEFADQTLPETLMPAYFDYWGERTGDEYWTAAAAQSRDLLRAIVNPSNGLSPSAAYFDGTLVEGEKDFREGSYFVALNLAIDTAWYGVDSEQVVLANRLVSFFAAFGGSYPSLFTYDGQPQSPSTSGALVALNGCAAGIATVPEREGLIRSVWETPLQVGAVRYFDGVNQLLSMMYLGGYVRPY